ncbi:class I SAM-dependent methyltransferase [soil metagenome]|jgi:ubiquinone/menaquinone biosynthesis C-methylase UbiE
MAQITGYIKETEHSNILDPDFEALYINVRYREKRVLTDCQLMFLPEIDANHLHYREWQVRKRSSERLTNYLAKKNKPLKILEIGCGNGWLSSKLSAVPGTRVVGLDINQVEIIQANRVFKKQNLEFIWDSFKPDLFYKAKFDVILFAASIQYFASLPDVLNDALKCLAEKGEIHILDTHFYKINEISKAEQRTANYYSDLGYPEMAAHYFHHSLNGFQQFNYKILADPGSLVNRISKKEPFYWIAVTH